MHANAPPIFSTVIFHCGGGAGRQLQPVLTPQNSRRSDAKLARLRPKQVHHDALLGLPRG